MNLDAPKDIMEMSGMCLGKFLQQGRLAYLWYGLPKGKHPEQVGMSLANDFCSEYSAISMLCTGVLTLGPGESAST